MSLVMGLVNLVSIPAESDDIVTQVDGSHFSRLAWPTMQPSPQHAHTVIQFRRKEAICPKSGSSSQEAVCNDVGLRSVAHWTPRHLSTC